MTLDRIVNRTIKWKMKIWYTSTFYVEYAWIENAAGESAFIWLYECGG